MRWLAAAFAIAIWLGLRYLLRETYSGLRDAAPWIFAPIVFGVIIWGAWYEWRFRRNEKLALRLLREADGGSAPEHRGPTLEHLQSPHGLIDHGRESGSRNVPPR